MLWKKNNMITVNLEPDITISISKEKHTYTLIVKEKSTVIINFDTKDVQECYDAVEQYFGKETGSKINSDLREGRSLAG